MSEIVELTIETFGMTFDLVINCAVEPEELTSRARPGDIELTGVWYNPIYHTDPGGRWEQEHEVLYNYRSRRNLLVTMNEEDVERLTELAKRELIARREYRQWLDRKKGVLS